MLGWIFVAALGIVWAIFLFPFIRRRMRSPVTTVEEFEQKMDYLAETHSRSRGRWVLTPRRDERFLGRSGRTRSRVRMRRRQVLVLLLEATGLAILIGLFPPFHRILIGAAALAVVLLLYVLALIRIRLVEEHRAQARRSRSSRMAAYGYETYPAYADGRSNRVPARAAYPQAASNGYEVPASARTAAYAAYAGYDDGDDWSSPVPSSAPRANGHGTNGHGTNGYAANGHAPNGSHAPRRTTNGNGNGHRGDTIRLDDYESDWRASVADELAAHFDDPILFVDEDVHLVVHRSDEIDVSELRAAAVR
jgi:hypothetical protein